MGFHGDGPLHCSVYTCSCIQLPPPPYLSTHIHSQHDTRRRCALSPPPSADPIPGAPITPPGSPPPAFVCQQVAEEDCPGPGAKRPLNRGLGTHHSQHTWGWTYAPLNFPTGKHNAVTAVTHLTEGKKNKNIRAYLAVSCLCENSSFPLFLKNGTVLYNTLEREWNGRCALRGEFYD